MKVIHLSVALTVSTAALTRPASAFPNAYGVTSVVTDDSRRYMATCVDQSTESTSVEAFGSGPATCQGAWRAGRSKRLQCEYFAERDYDYITFIGHDDSVGAFVADAATQWIFSKQGGDYLCVWANVGAASGLVIDGAGTITTRWTTNVIFDNHPDLGPCPVAERGIRPHAPYEETVSITAGSAGKMAIAYRQYSGTCNWVDESTSYPASP